MEKKKDRRIIRTRKMLSVSLLDLIAEKEYDEISIKDITNRANIGRSTFYEHYENKDQLLFSGHEELKKVMESSSKSNSSFETKLLLNKLFEHIAEYRSISKEFVNKKSGELMLGRLMRIMEDHFKKVAKKEVTDDEKINLFSTSFSYSFIGFIKYWVQKKDDKLDVKYAVEKTEEIFNSLILIAKKKTA